MRGISIGKRHDFRQRKSETPIFDALTKCVFEFAKAGILPSQLQKLVIAPDAFLALYKEQKHSGEYNGEPPWINIGGVIIHRGNP